MFRAWERENRPFKRPLRAYACTGNATSSDAATYILAGFDGCVSKPIYPHVFRSLLSNNKARVQSALVQGTTHRWSNEASLDASSCEGTPPSTTTSHPPSPHLPPQPTPARSSPWMMGGERDSRGASSRAAVSGHWGNSIRSPAADSRDSRKESGDKQTPGTGESASSVEGADGPKSSDHHMPRMLPTAHVASSSVPPRSPNQSPGRLTHAQLPPGRSARPVGGMDVLSEGGSFSSKGGGSSINSSSIASPVASSPSRPSSFTRTRQDATSAMARTRSSELLAEAEAAKAARGEAPPPQAPQPTGEFDSLPSEIRALAVKLSAELPTMRLAAHELVTTMGQRPEIAVTFLERFVSYARGQDELISLAVASESWAPAVSSQPGVISRDRAQKTVRSIAHATKGAASMIGAHRFTAASLKLQQAAETLGIEGGTSAEQAAAKAAYEVWRHECAAVVNMILEGDSSKLIENSSGMAADSGSRSAPPLSRRSSTEASSATGTSAGPHGVLSSAGPPPTAPR